MITIIIKGTGMINLALVGSVAGNTLISTLSSKLVDKILNGQKRDATEKKQWLFRIKLELYSLLSNEVLSCNEHNFCTKKEAIKEKLSQIVLLIDDQQIIQTLENYRFILDEYDNAKELVDINTINQELLHTLSCNIKNN